MTIFYYPTLLGFVPSTLAYILNPDLADNGVHTGIVIVVVFWLGMFMSARGGTGGIAKLASSTCRSSCRSSRSRSSARSRREGYLPPFFQQQNERGGGEHPLGPTATTATTTGLSTPLDPWS
jgi:hypothetical protein